MKKFLACLILIQAACGGGVSAMDESKFDCRAELGVIQTAVASAKMLEPLRSLYGPLVQRAEAEILRGEQEACFRTINEIRTLLGWSKISSQKKHLFRDASEGQNCLLEIRRIDKILTSRDFADTPEMDTIFRNLRVAKKLAEDKRFAECLSKLDQFYEEMPALEPTTRPAE
jgi:hypothetical protein